MRILLSGIVGSVIGAIVATTILTWLSVVVLWPTENMAGTFGLAVGPPLGLSIGGLVGALSAIPRPTQRRPQS